MINITQLLIQFGLLLIAMTFHEFAHGLVAYKLGDQTAKSRGRLTLNPLAHIDPIGTVLLPIILYFSTGGRFIFGAAKPVPINYQALRNPKRDIIWIGASGPCANLIVAAAAGLSLRILSSETLLTYMLQYFTVINVVLAVFNLLPIPPLDGSRIVYGLLPAQAAEQYMRIERFGFFIIMGLVAVGATDVILWPIVTAILRIFLR